MDLKDFDETENYDEDWLIREGKRALKYTNDFRAQNNLPEIKWNQELCNIAKEHCNDMATGRVPIGHEGFNKRFKQVSFYIRSFSENVAWNQNNLDPINGAVNGWINSPGHRKNLLS